MNAIDETMKRGGAVFPVVLTHPSGQPCQFVGLTLRDYFAGQALAGLCANEFMSKAAEKCADQPGFFANAQYAKCAVSLADALLAELGKEK